MSRLISIVHRALHWCGLARGPHAEQLELPLRYLQYRRLIKYTPRSDATLSIAVTFAGADRAIRLHTRRGRMDLWYREHKDGILGLATTVAVSLVTALIVVLLTR